MEPAPPRNPFHLAFTVAQDDIDEQGHASNVRVLDWMNRAAVAHSVSLGFDVARYRTLGGAFVVRRHELDYLAPAFLGDALLALTWPTACRRATAERRHEVRRVADGRMIARGLNVWAWVDAATGKPTRMPDEVAAAFDPARFV